MPSEAPEIADFLKTEWEMGGGQLSTFWLGYNRLYRWQGKDDFFIKWTSGLSRPFEAVAANIDYQRYLFDQGAPVPEPASIWRQKPMTQRAPSFIF